MIKVDTTMGGRCVCNCVLLFVVLMCMLFIRRGTRRA